MTHTAPCGSSVLTSVDPMKPAPPVTINLASGGISLQFSRALGSVARRIGNHHSGIAPAAAQDQGAHHGPHQVRLAGILEIVLVDLRAEELVRYCVVRNLDPDNFSVGSAGDPRRG